MLWHFIVSYLKIKKAEDGYLNLSFLRKEGQVCLNLKPSVFESGEIHRCVHELQNPAEPSASTQWKEMYLDCMYL